jgi:hypothetical protein
MPFPLAEKNDQSKVEAGSDQKHTNCLLKQGGSDSLALRAGMLQSPHQLHG